MLHWRGIIRPVSSLSDLALNFFAADSNLSSFRDAMITVAPKLKYVFVEDERTEDIS